MISLLRYRTTLPAASAPRPVLLLCLLLLSVGIHSEHIEASYSLTLTAQNLNPNRETLFEENRGSLGLANGPFRLVGDASIMGDKRYPAHSAYQLGRYFQLNDFSIDASFPDVELYAGYRPHRDVVKTPYSLYISSVEIPVLNGGFLLSFGNFTYENRWVRLNERSSIEYDGKDEPFRDRGLTFKTFAYDFGALTIGFQDSYIYMDQTFDAESFFMPVPTYLLELQLATPGRPWSQDNNVNSIVGFFSEWESGPYYLEGQILVDDINASLLAPLLGWAIPALYEIDNLQKVAWNIGGTMRLKHGTIGFYHGGATKYTFEATHTTPSNYSILPYEYLYYPATEYESPSGALRTVPYNENYIGYKHGENNLAFMIEYLTPLLLGSGFTFDLNTSAEWVINGSKSPANPWHEYNDWTEIAPRVELLSDDVLENLVKIKATASKQITPFDVSLSILLGYGWNRMKLVELVDNEPKIFVPQTGNNGLLFSVSLSGKYGVVF